VRVRKENKEDMKNVVRVRRGEGDFRGSTLIGLAGIYGAAH
jgi:hypothetical protein